MAQQNYGTFPSVDVEFDRDGKLVDPASIGRLTAMVENAAITDLFVMSHGWNNNMTEARALYDTVFKSVATQLDDPKNAGIRDRVFGVMAVLWPSKRFTDESAIPGGAASAGDARGDQLRQGLSELQDAFPERAADLDEAKKLIDSLESNERAQDRFVEILAAVMQPPSQTDVGMDSVPSAMKTRKGDVLRSLQGPVGVRKPRSFDGGGAAEVGTHGGAADLGGFFRSIKDAALGALNVTTYFTMKERAGKIGEALAPLLDKLRGSAKTPRLHLVGHSFGARLVTSAANHAQQPVATLSLLQAAYSHYGFAKSFDGTAGHDGFFRNVVAQHKVSGPIIITHSVQDKAVGLAYPIASRIGGQIAAALGDANDPFGGMGRNGAQKTPEVPNVNAALLPVGADYTLANGVPNNLQGDTIITSHGDIGKPAVTYAVLRSIART
ncbi:MAG: hypothetical protein QOD51_253 [Candidatus Eremiobacteraeota bacterium]|nr:hypothetical protein [Candidatus Eremiobacteraeota bacterium]